MNQVVLTGRLTKDPELKTTSSDKSVASFTIAVDRYKEGADFINCIVWGKQAENLAKYQGKGSLIGVFGKLQVRDFEDSKGNKRYITEVVVDNIEYLGTKKEMPKDEAEEFKKISSKTITQESIKIENEDLPW